MLGKKISKVLVLAPHTDDGELGCGGTIHQLISHGKRVIYVAFSTCEESVPEGFPKDILKMLEYRNLKGKAKVHLLFHIETCKNIEKQNLLKAIEEDFYIVDISDDELEKKAFENKFSCEKQLKPKVFFGLPNVK